MDRSMTRPQWSALWFAAFMLLVGVNPALAQIDQWRTQTQVSVGGNGLPLQFAFDGGLNQASSFATLATTSATPMASSSLDAGGYIPTLRVWADSPTRSQAVAWGVQGYTNTSGSALNTSLVLDLSASITGSNDLIANVYLFKDENFEFAFDNGTILFESSSELWDGFAPYANNLGPDGFDISFNNYSGDIAETRQFDFTVAAGDSFYVWARLVGTADNPGVVDAYSTLTASLTNTDGLVVGNVAPIPEPETYAMLLAGLGLLGWQARRRKMKQAA